MLKIDRERYPRGIRMPSPCEQSAEIQKDTFSLFDLK